MSNRYPVAYRKRARNLGFQQSYVPYPFAAAAAAASSQAAAARAASVKLAAQAAATVRRATEVVTPRALSYYAIGRPPILPGLLSLYGLGLLYKFGPFQPSWWQAEGQRFAGWTKQVVHAPPDGIAVHVSAGAGYVHEIQSGADGVREDHSGAPHIGDQTQNAGAWPRETAAVTVFTAAAVCTEGIHWRTHSTWVRSSPAVPAPVVRGYAEVLPSPAEWEHYTPLRWINPMIKPVSSPAVIVPPPLPVRFPRPVTDVHGSIIRSNVPPGVAGTPARPGQVGFGKLPRKPGRATKEQKVLETFAGYRSLNRFIRAWTEAHDLVDCLWEALPRFNWKGSDRHIRPDISRQKAKEVFDRFDEIDWGEAVRCIAAETIEDRAYAWVGRRMRDAVRANPYYRRPVGIQTGGYLRRLS